MSLIHKDCGTRQLVQFAKPGGMRSSQRFKKLNRRGHYDGSTPECGELTELQVLELCPMVVLGDDVLRPFARQHERIPVDFHRLANDIRVGKNDEDAAQILSNRGLKQMSHDRCRLTTADRGIAGADRRLDWSGTTTFKHPLPKVVPSRVHTWEVRNKAVEGCEALLPPGVGRDDGHLPTIIVRRISVISIHQT